MTRLDKPPAIRINRGDSVERCVEWKQVSSGLGRGGSRGKILGKTHIGELFFKERVLRLPSPWPKRFKIAISEGNLRLLITSLIVLFLLVLGSALLIQLMESRRTHVNEQNRLSGVYGQLAVQHIKMDFAQAAAAGVAPPIVDTSYLYATLPSDALTEQRIFAIAENLGTIIASLPTAANFDGKPITSILSANFITDMEMNSGRMAPLVLASGEEAFVSLYDLGGFPGSLIVIQRQQDVLSAWRSSVTQVTTLFTVTLLVLMLLGAAFHWQAAKAAEADAILGVATARLDKALDRGQCGMWDWDVSKGIIFWSRSMFDILGMPVKGDYLSFAEVVSRIHPNDTQLETAVENRASLLRLD